MKQTVLIGGYTRSVGKGIYRATFDDETGELTTPEAYVTALGSPTYLAVSKANVAYAVNAGDGEGGVAAVDLNGETPTVLNAVMQPGSSPAHVSIDEERQLVFASNYHEGRLNVYAINQDHSLQPVDEVQHVGKGPRPEQDSAHVHFAGLTPDGRVVAVDLGNDTLATYRVDASGKLSDQQVLSLPAGYGPRHLVFHPTLPLAYLLGELSSQISVMSYADGHFSELNTQTTIPADWTAHNGAAAIRISRDGRFVYVSNRGYNSIAVFAVSEDGQALTLIQQISTEGEFPRDFNLDLTERFVLAVNQNTNNGTLFARDAETGKLALVQKDIVTPEAVNVTFLPAEKD